MFKHKKITAILLTMCLFFTLAVVGCSKNDKEVQQDAPQGSTNNSDSQGETGNDPEETQLKPVTLRYLLPGDKGVDSDKVFDEFNEKLKAIIPNTTIEFEMVPTGEYKEKWDLMMAAGEVLDIAWTGWMIPFAEEVEKGSYMELDQLVNTYGPKLLTELPGWVLEYGKVNNKLYAIASNKDATELRLGMYTPKELFEAYWDMDVLEEVFYKPTLPYRAGTEEMYGAIESYLQKIKEAGDIRSGVSMEVWTNMNKGITLTGPAMVRLARRGEEWDFTVRNYYELPETKLLYQTTADWFKKGYIRQDILSLQNRREFENINSKDGNVAWFHTYFNSQDPDALYRDVTNYTYPGIQVMLEKDFYLSRLDSSSGTVIPRTSENPERAMMVIELLNTTAGKELFNLLAFGIEGEHYEVVSEGVIKLLRVPNEPPKHYIMNFAVGNMIANSYETEDSQGYYEYLDKEVNGKAIVSPILGFRPNTESIMNEISQCRAVIGEYEAVLITGALGDGWEEKYEEFINKLKVAGADKIVNEMQTQLDKFLELKGLEKTGVIAE